eukprot:Skav217263  [mRNA]  locus=scaffold47:1353722:1356062:+ [translate_table: standard]
MSWQTMETLDALVVSFHEELRDVSRKSSSVDHYRIFFFTPGPRLKGLSKESSADVAIGRPPSQQVLILTWTIEQIVPFLELLQRLQDCRVLRSGSQKRLEVILPIIGDHRCEGGFGIQMLLQVGQR